MSSQRVERVQEAIRQEVSMIIHDKIRDPRVGFITITGVELTKDLRYARIYFSVLGDDKVRNRALIALTKAKGFVKGLLGEKIKLRFMPEIEFKLDDTLEHRENIFKLFSKIENERKKDALDNRGDQKT